MMAILPEPSLTGRQPVLRDALVDLVLPRDSAHLTVDQIAAQLNCSKRTLYALAASKEQLAVLAVRHFFKRSTDQVEAAIARTRAPARRVTRYLEAVAEALRPASRAFRDDVASFRPAAEIYEQNTVTAARAGPRADRRGHPGRGVPAGAGRVRRRGGDGHHAPDHQRGDHRGDRAERRRGVRRTGPAGGRGRPPMSVRGPGAGPDGNILPGWRKTCSPSVRS